jgi:hypothetical protein
MRSPPVSRAPASWQPYWPRPRCPRRRLISCVLSRPRRRPCPKPTDTVRARHRHCPAASAVASSSTVSGARAPLAAFSSMECWSYLPLPPLCRKTAAGHRSPRLVRERRRRSSFSPPPRRQGTPVSYHLHPRAQWVASPPWVLERRRFLHLRHCSATAGRAVTRARRAVTAPACARALRRVVAGRASRGRPSKPWATRCGHRPSRRCGHGPRATVQLGRAPFRPSGSRISFPFSEYIQIITNLKICVGFIWTRKIMNQILLDRS